MLDINSRIVYFPASTLPMPTKENKLKGMSQKSSEVPSKQVSKLAGMTQFTGCQEASHIQIDHGLMYTKAGKPDRSFNNVQ